MKRGLGSSTASSNSTSNDGPSLPVLPAAGSSSSSSSSSVQVQPTAPSSSSTSAYQPPTDPVLLTDPFANYLNLPKPSSSSSDSRQVDDVLVHPELDHHSAPHFNIPGLHHANTGGAGAVGVGGSGGGLGDSQNGGEGGYGADGNYGGDGGYGDPHHQYTHDDDHDGSERNKRRKIKTSAPRTSRACLLCRRQKMRCEGAEDPPCKRCKTGGHECIFERRSDFVLNPQDSAWQTRIEHRLTTLTTTVEAILTALESRGVRVQLAPIAPPALLPLPIPVGNVARAAAKESGGQYADLVSAAAEWEYGDATAAAVAATAAPAAAAAVASGAGSDADSTEGDKRHGST